LFEGLINHGKLDLHLITAYSKREYTRLLYTVCKGLVEPVFLLSTKVLELFQACCCWHLVIDTHASPIHNQTKKTEQ